MTQRTLCSVIQLQESSAKLCLGDEIVKIGEKLVCSFSYQEICELMHNLPMTLSLEVKRPVAGKALKGQAVFWVFICSFG